MQTNPTFKTNAWTIGAGQSIAVQRVGDFLSCLEADQPFEIQFDDGVETEFFKGITYDADVEYKKVRLINPNDAEIFVKVAFGRGGLKDSRLTLGGGSEVVSVSTVSPDTLTTSAPVDCLDGAATLIAAANAARKEIVITNSGAGKVFVQGAAGGAGEGIPLAVDQTTILTTSAAVHIRNDTGATVSINVAEIEVAA